MRCHLLPTCPPAFLPACGRSDAEIQEMITEADRNDDDKIDFEEFYRVMKVCVCTWDVWGSGLELYVSVAAFFVPRSL